MTHLQHIDEDSIFQKEDASVTFVSQLQLWLVKMCISMTTTCSCSSLLCSIVYTCLHWWFLDLIFALRVTCISFLSSKWSALLKHIYTLSIFQNLFIVNFWGVPINIYIREKNIVKIHIFIYLYILYISFKYIFIDIFTWSYPLQNRRKWLIHRKLLIIIT